MNHNENLPSTAVFWGTFDPPTLAHGAIVEVALKTLLFQRLIIVVNASPRKGTLASLEYRLAMLRIMLEDLGLMDRVELLIQEPGRLLDYQTLRRDFGAPLAVIAGADSLVAWIKTAKDLEAYDGVWIAEREGSVHDFEHAKLHSLPLSASLAGVSSSKVRAALGEGNSIDGMIHPRVAAYIKEYGFYGNF